MAELKIDQSIFLMALGRDVDYHDPYPREAYLDLESGHIEWVYENDDDAETEGISAAGNRILQNCIKAKPNSFLLIQGLSHGDHHDILKAFLASEWTDDEELRKVIREAYFGSIGGWKKTIDDEGIFYTYCDFRGQKVLELATSFLIKNGVKFDWI